MRHAIAHTHHNLFGRCWTAGVEYADNAAHGKSDFRPDRLHFAYQSVARWKASLNAERIKIHGLQPDAFQIRGDKRRADAVLIRLPEMGSDVVLRIELIERN